MNFRSLLSVAVLAASAASASAAPITPTFDYFGTLAGATFGGSGIPNDAVAVSKLDRWLAPDVTVGLTAHQRYDAPALTNDGNGTFYAQAGVSSQAPSPSDPYALWNIGFYAAGAVAYRLTYDFDPAADTEQSAHGWFSLVSGEDSLNLGMDYLDGWNIPLLISEPDFDWFDPMALGEYTFGLTAYNILGGELARTAIKVVVGNSVPEPASLALVGIALLGLAASRRRKA